MKKILFSSHLSENPKFVKDGKGDFMEISIFSYDYVHDGKEFSLPYITIMEEEDRGTSGVKCHLSNGTSLNWMLNYVKEFFDEKEMAVLKKNSLKYKKEILLFEDGHAYLFNLKTQVKNI